MTIAILITVLILGIVLIIALCMASIDKQEKAYIEYARRQTMYKKLKKEMNMKGHPAGAKAMQIFKNTANRGNYKNSPKIQPRGGTSFK